MSVYVDEPIWSYKRMKMCHMVADTPDELHEMANLLGLKRHWFQGGNFSLPHYDICKSKRALAIKYGAIEIDKYKLVEMIKANRDKKAKQDQP